MTFSDPDDNKIIRLPTPEERAQRVTLKEQAKTQINTPPPTSAGQRQEPLINLPPVTKYMLGVFILIHLVMMYGLSPDQKEYVFLTFGMVPELLTRGTGALPFLTSLTHMFLHGGWVHLIMNGVMLMAFGSGVERDIGGRKMFFVFIFCGLCGALLQYAMAPLSLVPMIGASGGISGLFALAIIIMHRRGGGSFVHPKYGFWPLIILWVGISILFGMMGSPDGSPVAWGAHVGGFLAGFLAIKLFKV